MSRDTLDPPPRQQTPRRPLNYLVFGPTDTLMQLLMRLCRQGCPQVTRALGCSRQGASGVAETSPDLELCHENHTFLQRPDDELRNHHLLAKILSLQHCPIFEISAEASNAEMQLRKYGLSMKHITRARKATPAESTYSQYGLSCQKRRQKMRNTLFSLSCSMMV